ncbi:NADH-quinone oxidoreductase subunit 5 family protein [Flammeovirga sp. MY04]|uniref:NADH-quinone oxidoreductase subunit 5 family protein n=1 Tax=Flammeovirga sp. MY04 TaxID=1191459 RepID=UPI002151F0FD|nr:NADH-quinone oxidoreductase subunit L [Flammeovirga sp. MY04]
MNFIVFITLLGCISPLLGMFLIQLIGKSALVDKIGTTLIGVSIVCHLFVFSNVWVGEPIVLSIDWLKIGQHQFNVDFKWDALTSLLLSMVSVISLFVHVFSSAYMQGDPSLKRYYSLLGLFTFSMFGVLISDHLIFLYLFWELVGFCSYMLIGFWREKQLAISAAKKAFVVNRIGDAGFMVALVALYSQFNTLSLSEIQSQFAVSELQVHLLMIAGVGVMLAAMGKSAQIPFAVWLPDAMQGPTPVSALIHAATMVAAGIYLLVRCYFFLPEEILLCIALVGGVTAFVAAFAALTQYDIKRILAFSTISQLGYMMLSIGVGDPSSSVYHLITHAFFKAGLFLGAGAVIHSMHQVSCDICKGFDPQDIRWMGNLRKYMPKTFIGFSICLAGLAGVPFTTGFLSKDAILNTVLARGLEDGGIWIFIMILGFSAAALTSFYCLRMFYHVFLKDLGIANHKVCKDCLVLPKEVNSKMYLPVMILGFCTLWFTMVINPFETSHSWLQDGIGVTQIDHHQHHTLAVILSVSMLIVGLGVAYFIFILGKGIAFKKSFKASTLYKLSYNFFYLNELYKFGAKLLIKTGEGLDKIPHADEYFVNSAIVTSEFVRGFDDKVVDFFVKVFAVGNVVIGHVLAWFDKDIVDGCVKLFTRFMQLLGDVFRKPQGERSQSMIAWSVILLAIILGILI